MLQGILLLLACLLLACSEQAERTHRAPGELPTIRGYATIRLDQDGSVPEVAASTVLDTVFVSGERWVVFGKAIFTEKDLVAAGRSAGNPKITDFQLGDSGTEALRQFSVAASASPTRLALRYGARWVAFPVITASIQDGRFIIPDLTDGEVDTAIAAFGSGQR
jgi:hypothetical protein